MMTACVVYPTSWRVPPEKENYLCCLTALKGTSLKQESLPGPDLSNTLLGVLLRFCQEPIALMADIEGMFHQVKVPSQDVNFLHFLWWSEGDTSKDISEYRMTVLNFGAVSSPRCASFALKKTVEENKDKYSNVTR